MNHFQEIYQSIRSKITTNSVSEIGWVFLGQVLSVGLGFAILKILSKMGTYDFGIYSLILTIIAFFGLIFYGPIQQGFLRFYYDYAEKNKTGIFVKLTYKILIISAVSLFILSVISVVVTKLFGLTEFVLLFFLAGVYVFTFKINEFFNSALNLLRKRKENSLLQGTEKIISIASLFLLLSNKYLTLTNVMLVLITVTFSFSIVKYLFFKKYLPKEDSFDQTTIKESQVEIRSKVFKYILPFLLWGLAGWLQQNGEKWIIANYLSTSDVGIYAIMIAIANALVVVPNNIINDFAMPIIYQQYSDLNNKEKLLTGRLYIRINMLLIFFISMVSTLITYLWGRQLIIIISNESYAVYWQLLPLICFGSGLFLTGQAQTVVGLALNKPDKYIFPKISIGIISVVLNIILINQFGLSGIAYSIIIIGLTYVLYIALVNKTILSSRYLET